MRPLTTSYRVWLAINLYLDLQWVIKWGRAILGGHAAHDVKRPVLTPLTNVRYHVSQRPVLNLADGGGSQD